MKTKETITLAIALPDNQGHSIVREITFDSMGFHGTPNSEFVSEEIFAAQIGRGVKMHSVRGTVLCFTPEEAKKYRYNTVTMKPNFVDEFGNVYYFKRNCSLRNRQAHIVGFAETYIGTNLETKQKYYGSLKAGA
jgi:hypothetical protein